MRHPQLSTIARSSTVVTNPLRADPRRMPLQVPTSAKLPKNPRLPTAVFDKKYRRDGIFSAYRNSLKQPHQHKQHRGCHSNLLIAGKYADQKGRDCHQRNRCCERRLAAHLVTDMAKEQTSQRAHQKTCREDAKRRNQGGDHVLRREKVAPDATCKIAVDAEIVPLHDIAGDAGNDGASFP